MTPQNLYIDCRTFVRPLSVAKNDERCLKMNSRDVSAFKKRKRQFIVGLDLWDLDFFCFFNEILLNSLIEVRSYHYYYSN